jgi:DnaJ-class molecular chaperone
MITYYDVLNVTPVDDKETIYNNYNNVISYYNNPNLTPDQQSQVKFIKMALYVLTNDNLKNKYNYYIYKEQSRQSKKPVSENSLKDFKEPQENNVVSANNEEDNQSLDNVFNVNTSWMNNNDSFSNNDDGKLDNKIISNRVFDLSNIYDRKINYDELKIEPNRGATREGKQINK